MAGARSNVTPEPHLERLGLVDARLSSGHRVAEDGTYGGRNRIGSKVTMADNREVIIEFLKISNAVRFSPNSSHRW